MVQFDTILSQSLMLSLPGILFMYFQGKGGGGLMERESLFSLVKQVKGRAILELRTSSFGCGELRFGSDISLII